MASNRLSGRPRRAEQNKPSSTRADPITYVRSSAPLAWLGLISYGIFLWHEPFAYWLWANGLDVFGEGVIGFFSLLLATLAIGIALGAFSYYIVEKPFHRR